METGTGDHGVDGWTMTRKDKGAVVGCKQQTIVPNTGAAQEELEGRPTLTEARRGRGEVTHGDSSSAQPYAEI